MIFEQYYLSCLSQASYLIGDETTGRAVVVDPRRDVEEYLDDAREHGLTIELVIETHFHADFLSGHLELAAATGAQIAYGETAEPQFAARKLADGERIELGDVAIEVVATPGHTPESISLVVYEHGGDTVPYGVLTGDTLFIGDVGRPDLLSSVGVTADELGRQLYHSVHDKLLQLPDATRVYPGHGAGSACGKQLSTATVSTLGDQRATNYALQPMTEDEFVLVVTEGQIPAPGYFSYDATMNRQDRELLDEHAPVPALSVDEVRRRQADGAVVLDTRPPNEFAAGHLLGAINVGLEGSFAGYVGSVVEPSTPIVLVCDASAEIESRNRLARIGFDNVIGHLDEPLRAFVDRPDVVVPASRLTADSLLRRLDEGIDVQVVDVRNPSEVAEQAVRGELRIPLSELRARVGEIDEHRPVVVMCAGGYRSMIASSYLSSSGFDDVSDLLGGFEAWAAVATG